MLHALALVFVMLLLPATAFAGSMRCDGNLVTRDDLAVEVLHKCGKPDFVDNWQQAAAGIGDIEQWYYNFGPSQLIQVLEFRDGRLRRINSADYGFNLPGQGACKPIDIVQGISKYHLLEKCGEPAQVNSLVVYANPNGAAGSRHYQSSYLVPVLREFWIYNFGPRSLLRRITLENGIVVNVNTHGRGFGNR